MEITIENYKDVLGKILITDNILIEHPMFVFSGDDFVHYYTLTSTFLSCITERNDSIFISLSLNKLKFCSEIYGEEPGNGCFPEYNGRDRLMLFKLAYALFQECEKQNTPVVTIPLSTLTKNSFLDSLGSNRKIC